MPSSDGDLATRPGAGRSGVVASPRSKMFAGRGVGDGGMMHGTRRPFLWSEQLLEQVRLRLRPTEDGRLAWSEELSKLWFPLGVPTSPILT